MTIDKAKLEALLDEAHEWLNAFREYEIRPAIESLIQYMDKKQQQGDFTSAWGFIERLPALIDQMQREGPGEIPERSVVRIECAKAAYRMGNLQEAIRLFEEAIELYGPKYGGHYEATARWMLGCVQWQAPHQEDQALVSWAKSIEIYQRLAYKSLERVSRSRSDWYSERVAKMRETLDLAIQPSVPVQAPGSSASGHVSATPPVDTLPTEPSYTSSQDALRLFSISAEVQAGDFTPTIADPNPLGYLEVDKCQINGVVHRIVNLRGSGHVIKMSPSRTYRVLRVHGDSMNADGIDDGNYVLLALQKTAHNNDIVAAIINDFDTEATLKRYFERQGEFILEFRSNNPIHKDDAGKNKRFIFTSPDEGFQIAGLALAVFKPV